MFSTVRLIIPALIGLCLYFAPSALAVLRGNVFKGQVIKYQVIIAVISIVVAVAIALVLMMMPVSAVKMSDSAGMATMENISAEQDAPAADEPIADAPASISRAGLNVLSIICMVAGGGWSLVSLVLWFYILLHALRDQQMTLLSRFGINI